MPKITVKSKGASFRRAGTTFTREGVTLDREALTTEQLEALVLEPNLVLFDPESETPERDQIADLEAFRAEARQRRHDERRNPFDTNGPKGNFQEFLLGSDNLPATILIGANTAQAGDIVAMAFTVSGSTVEQWNSPSSADERERLIQECLANLQADPSIFQAYLDSRNAAADMAKQGKPAKPAKGKATK